MNRPERRIQGDFSLPCSTLAFPLGGRWHGAAVTDEGAGFRLNSLYAGGFRRLRAASDFARGGKVTKTPPENGSGWTLRRRGFRIPRFVLTDKARSLHRSSSPTQTRCAGLCVGDRLQRPVWVENFSRCGSISTPGLTDQVAAGLQSAGRSGTGPYERRDGL